jgi:hypothetical protein
VGRKIPLFSFFPLIRTAGEAPDRGWEPIRAVLLESSFCYFGAPAMRNCILTTATVPYGADQTVYVVVDGLGQRGTFDQEREVERTDIETVLADLMSGHFNDPIRVVAFNTLEHWSEYFSTDVAREIQCRCDIDGSDVPQYLAGFMELHIRPTASLSNRWA